MKINIITLLVVAVLATTACQNKTANDKPKDSANAESANTEAKAENEVVLDSATKMNNMMAYMTPGDAHKMLASMSGEWTTETTSWWGGVEDKSTGKTINQMILGDRYQQSTYTGTMMGMPFSGISTTAYDNAKKVFVSTWIDNMGSGLSIMEGPWDDATKSMILKGKMVDSETYKEFMVKQVCKVVDDNTCIMEMYKVEGDKETKLMEQKSTRKGKKA